jgi:hypothetical protein
VPVPFGGDVPRGEPEQPGRDDERSIGARKRLAEGLDGAAIRIGSALEGPREDEVVLEREVDHAIRSSSGTAQGIEVVERAALHLCPGGNEGGGGGLRASQPHDLVPRADELRDDGGADPAGRPGDENTHASHLPLVERPR